MKDEMTNDERPTETHFVDDSDLEGQGDSFHIRRWRYCTMADLPGLMEQAMLACVREGRS